MQAFTLKQVIETAIHAEELGIKFYSEMAKKFADNEKLKNIFELLAKDEVEHKKQFQELAEENTQLPFNLTEEDTLYFKGCDVSKFFPSMEETNEKLTPERILKNAFEFEKESVLFYTGIRYLIPMSDKLDLIIKTEKNHMTKLIKYIISDSEFRGIEDNF